MGMSAAQRQMCTGQFKCKRMAAPVGLASILQPYRVQPAVRAVAKTDKIVSLEGIPYNGRVRFAAVGF